MQFFALLTTAALAAAAPSVLETRGGEKVCASGAPYCCQLDVLGVAAVSCSDGKYLPDLLPSSQIERTLRDANNFLFFFFLSKSVPGSPKSVDEFNKECKHTGLSAQCCEVGGIVSLNSFSLILPLSSLFFSAFPKLLNLFDHGC